jgi:hypothetical protein
MTDFAERSHFSGEKVLYVVCALRGHTTYSTHFLSTALFRGSQ